MRVLFGIEAFWPHIGGAEVLAARLLPALRKRGFELAVVTSRSAVRLPDEDDFDGIPVYRFPFHEPLAERDLVRVAGVSEDLRRLRRAFKPDLVHLHNIGPDVFYHLRTAADHPAPMLITMHSAPAAQVRGDNNLTAKALRAATWIAAVSRGTLSEILRLVPSIVPRSSVVLNGLDMPEEKPTGLLFDKPALVCLGRLTEQKGFDLALSALPRVLDAFPEVRLIIAGDGIARLKLEQQVSVLKLEQQVEFLGRVEPERVPALLNQATIVVMPSRFEGLGLVAIQAAQMARPVVGTRVGGLREVVLHKKTGLLIDKEDSSALARGIIDLLNNPGLAKRMGESARERAARLFSLGRCADGYDTLYRHLIHIGRKNP